MADSISNSIEQAKGKKNKSESDSLAKSLNKDMIRAFDSNFSELKKESKKSTDLLKESLEKSNENSKNSLDLLMLSSVATDEFQKAMFKVSNEQLKVLTSISKNMSESKEETSELKEMFGDSDEQKMKLIDAFSEVGKPKGDDAENSMIDKLNEMFSDELAPMLMAMNDSVVDDLIAHETKLAKKEADRAKAAEDEKIDAEPKEKELTGMKPKESGGLFGMKTFGKMGGAVASVLKTMGKGLGIAALVAGVVNGLRKMFTMELDTNASLSDQFASVISQFIEGLTFGLFQADKIKATIAKGTGAIGDAINFIVDSFTPLFDRVGTFFSQVGSVFKTLVTMDFETMKKEWSLEAVGNTIKNVFGMVADLGQGIINIFTGLYDKIKNMLPESLREGISDFGNFLSKAKDTIIDDVVSPFGVGEVSSSEMQDAEAKARQRYLAARARRMEPNNVEVAQIDMTPSRISKQVNDEKMKLLREQQAAKENQQPVVVNNNNTQVIKKDPTMSINDYGLRFSMGYRGL